MRTLFLATYPVEAAATRFRCVQYFPYLRDNGIECILRPFLPARLFSRLYERRQWFTTGAGLLAAAVRRLLDLPEARAADVVFIQREASLLGPPLIEWAVARLFRKPFVFDFDDSVLLPYVSPTYGRLGTWLKRPGKVSLSLRAASRVIAGNENLALQARVFNPEVAVIPTVVDATVFKPAAPAVVREVPTVGWIGSPTTTQYFNLIAPVLRELAAVVPYRLLVVGADDSLDSRGLPVTIRKWDMSREVKDFQELDIGLYPLRDDEWAAGKSGFKAIQYMAVGIPCVASRVGAAADIVRDGETGLLVRTSTEWKAAVSRLAADSLLRRRLGEAGRRHVEAEYSLAVQAPRLAQILREAAARPGAKLI